MLLYLKLYSRYFVRQGVVHSTFFYAVFFIIDFYHIQSRICEDPEHQLPTLERKNQMTTFAIVMDKITSHAFTIRYSDLKAWFCGMMTLDQRLLRILDFIAQEDSSILEINCGSGRLTHAISKRFSALFGLIAMDEDSYIVETAAHRCGVPMSPWADEQYENADGSLQICSGDASNMPGSDASLDTIVWVRLSQDQSENERKRTIRECFRLLKKGSRMVVVDYGAPCSLLGSLRHFIFGYKSMRNGGIERLIFDAEKAGFISPLHTEKVHRGWIHIVLFRKPVGGVPGLKLRPAKAKKG